MENQTPGDVSQNTAPAQSDSTTLTQNTAQQTPIPSVSASSDPIYTAAPQPTQPEPVPQPTPTAQPIPVTENPGKTLGIAAFILAFFCSIVGLILGIVALRKSKKVGQSNGFALAAIIISIIFTS